MIQIKVQLLADRRVQLFCPFFVQLLHVSNRTIINGFTANSASCAYKNLPGYNQPSLVAMADPSIISAVHESAGDPMEDEAQSDPSVNGSDGSLVWLW